VTFGDPSAWENPPNPGHGCGFSVGDFESTRTRTRPTHTRVPVRVCKPVTGPTRDLSDGGDSCPPPPPPSLEMRVEGVACQPPPSHLRFERRRGFVPTSTTSLARRGFPAHHHPLGPRSLESRVRALPAHHYPLACLNCEFEHFNPLAHSNRKFERCPPITIPLLARNDICRWQKQPAHSYP